MSNRFSTWRMKELRREGKIPNTHSSVELMTEYTVCHVTRSESNKRSFSPPSLCRASPPTLRGAGEARRAPRHPASEAASLLKLESGGGGKFSQPGQRCLAARQRSQDSSRRRFLIVNSSPLWVRPVFCLPPPRAVNMPNVPRTVTLKGPSPWGFRLVGGRDFSTPLTISRVRTHPLERARSTRHSSRWTLDSLISLTTTTSVSLTMHTTGLTLRRQSSRLPVRCVLGPDAEPRVPPGAPGALRISNVETRCARSDRLLDDWQSCTWNCWNVCPLQQLLCAFEQ